MLEQLSKCKNSTDVSTLATWIVGAAIGTLKNPAAVALGVNRREEERAGESEEARGR